MKAVVVAILVYGALLCSAGDSCDYPATIESGVVCGKLKKATNGDEFVSFLGIRYAKPPVGKYRYALPQKPDKINGTFDATEEGPTCFQPKTLLIEPLQPVVFDEDCLRMHVHTPNWALDNANSNDKNETLLPVYFYIHGGSFSFSSGSPKLAGPEYIVSKGIILVSFNFRLNSIGFLSLASKEIPGNLGLRDIVHALEWVRDNIKNFGGNPHDVSIGGISSGAAAISLVSISPSVNAKNLFHKVMAQSGNAIANFFCPSPLTAKMIADEFLTAMKIPLTLSKKEIYKKLIAADINDIADATTYLMKTKGMTFAPVIEGCYEGITPILPKNPEALMRDGYGSQYPTIISFTDGECNPGKSLYEGLVKLLKVAPILYVPSNLLYFSRISKIPTYISRINSEYFNGLAPTVDTYMDFCTDVNYRYPALRNVDIRLKTNASKTWVYQFQFSPDNTLVKNYTHMNWKGAGHSEDLLYWVRVNSVLGPLRENELEQPNDLSRMSKKMTDIIANFIKIGRPTEDMADWPPTTREMKIQIIAEPTGFEFEKIPLDLSHKKTFWDELYSLGFHYD